MSYVDTMEELDAIDITNFRDEFAKLNSLDMYETLLLQVYEDMKGSKDV